MEDYLFVSLSTLFVAVLCVLMIVLWRKQNEITLWYIKRGNRKLREKYISENRESLQNSLTEHTLTIYLDKELDDAHRKAELKYNRSGQAYFWYIEKSYDLATLMGHSMSFDDASVEVLISEFLIVRWWLIKPLLHYENSILISRYLTILIQPFFDTKTKKRIRREQRRLK